MTVHIEGVRILILAVGCLVGYATYKHSRKRHEGLPAGPGDVIGAIGAGAAVITVLMLLFGDVTNAGQEAPPAPASVVTEQTAPTIQPLPSHSSAPNHGS
jgi:hypothetical protein